MASGIHNRWKANVMNQEIDMEGDVIKVMLLTDSHAFDATHNQLSEIVANEVAGTGYDAGGKALVSKAVTQGATTKWDADDLEWTVATFIARYAVPYDDDMANDDLICCFDFGANKSVSGGTFTLQFHTDGIIALT